MGKSIQVRALVAADIEAVLSIQARCYGAEKIESAAAFLSKIQASPGTSVLALHEDAPVGYLVAVPAAMASPPPLNSTQFDMPAAPDCLYLHDLSVDPALRGAGVADALVQEFLRTVTRLGFARACLTAVNGSAPYWMRYGFSALSPSAALQEKLESYGAEAQYMCLELKDRA